MSCGDPLPLLLLIKSHQVTQCESAIITCSWLATAYLVSKHQQGGFWSSGMWHCVAGLVVPITVKEHAAFIFKGQDVQTIILGLLQSEVKNTVILLNPGKYFPNNTASHSQRPDFSETLLWHLKSHSNTVFCINNQFIHTQAAQGQMESGGQQSRH